MISRRVRDPARSESAASDENKRQRVAQVIKRNGRDLGRTGYDAAQQFAKRARDDARTQVDERRQLESLAVQDAQRTRESERDLETKQRELQACPLYTSPSPRHRQKSSMASSA